MAERMLTTLSGGELQRVQIAIALAQEAPALIADEPTSHLDLGGSAAMATLLRTLADDGLTVLLVLHDLALAAAIADRVVVMADGRTVASGAGQDALTPERIAEVWRVGATLSFPSAGQTALRVDWLGDGSINRLEEVQR
jgi:iron complex transport system ATP-binding protein